MIINSIHKVFTLSIIMLLCGACESTKNTNNTKVQEIISKISIEKTTLGSNSLFEIDKKEIKTSSTLRNGAEDVTNKSTKPEQWNEVNRLVSGIDLNEMSNWEAPTQERFYDGAKATVITIESNGKEYVSQSFDEGKPPAQLQKLYDYLESLVNQ